MMRLKPGLAGRAASGAGGGRMTGFSGMRNEKSRESAHDAGGMLYRALAAGDLPAAWLATRPLLERAKGEKLPAATAFNCGLCLYRLEEYEKALAQLKAAEQLLGSPPDLDSGERRLFVQAVESVKKERQACLLPLDPEGDGLKRYFLIRVRWLAGLCLLCLGRRQEAAPLIRFLAQYHIEL